MPVSITVETDLNSPTEPNEKQQLLSGDVVEVDKQLFCLLYLAIDSLLR